MNSSRRIEVVVRAGEPDTNPAVGWLPDASCSSMMAEFCPSALERVETAEDAERLRFVGSPTILIDGRDPFGGTEGTGSTCMRPSSRSAWRSR